MKTPFERKFEKFLYFSVRKTGKSLSITGMSLVQAISIAIFFGTIFLDKFPDEIFGNNQEAKTIKLAFAIALGLVIGVIIEYASAYLKLLGLKKASMAVAIAAGLISFSTYHQVLAGDLSFNLSTVARLLGISIIAFYPSFFVYVVSDKLAEDMAAQPEEHDEEKIEKVNWKTFKRA